MPGARTHPEITHRRSGKASAATALHAVGTAAARRGPRLLRRCTGLILIIALWQYSAADHWWHGNIPSPGEVWAAFTRLQETGLITGNLSVSLHRVARGFALGAGAGLAMGTAAGLFRIGEDLFDPPYQAIRMVPVAALVPLFIVWFGIGDTAMTALISFATFGPLYLNTYHGIRNIDVRYVEAARSFGLGQVRVIGHVVLPGALPHILVGIRQAVAVAWFSLVIAEAIKTDAGLGYLLTDAQQFLRTDQMFVVLVIYATLGLLADVGLRLLERVALAWHRGIGVA
ncbi:MAG TPA: ABC transporter permease [Kineosporiaceae bacterium]